MIVIVILLLGAAVLLLFGAASNMSKTNCPPPPAPSPQILAMAQAIQVAEGSPAEWNNPGDLTASFGYPTNGTGNSAGVLIFVNCEDGWNALYKQLEAIVNCTSSHYSTDQTLAQMGLTYSGGDPNWAKNVAASLGVSTDTQLGDILA